MILDWSVEQASNLSVKPLFMSQYHFILIRFIYFVILVQIFGANKQ